MGEIDELQSKAAEVVNPEVVVHDLTVISETTPLAVNETTSSDKVSRGDVSDQLVEDIASELMLEDVRGTTSLPARNW